VRNVYVLFDSVNIYIGFNVSSQYIENLELTVYFASPKTSLSPFNPGYNVIPEIQGERPWNIPGSRDID